MERDCPGRNGVTVLNMEERKAFGLGAFDGEFAGRAANARGRLTATDERILAHFRESQDGVDGLAFHTAESLGESVGVSRAAIVRFARKLGYSGFAEFRAAVRQALLSSQESPLSRFSNTEPDSLAERKAIQDTKNVLATAALARDTLGPAAAAVAGSRRVCIIGARLSYGLAVQLHRLLNEIRDGVTLVDPGFPDAIVGLAPRDLVIAFHFRRYSRLTADLLRTVGAARAQVVLITDGRGHASADHAHHVLVASVDGPALYDSMVAPMWLLESLAAEVAAVSPAASRARLEVVEHFTKDHRLLLG
jgi:DNA-binding MurR/RpiR family transcriptional regulator